MKSAEYNQIVAYLHHAEQSKYSYHHLHLLSAAGFAAVDVLYKRDIFAIYAGVK